MRVFLSQVPRSGGGRGLTPAPPWRRLSSFFLRRPPKILQRYVLQQTQIGGPDRLPERVNRTGLIVLTSRQPEGARRQAGYVFKRLHQVGDPNPRRRSRQSEAASAAPPSLQQPHAHQPAQNRRQVSRRHASLTGQVAGRQRVARPLFRETQHGPQGVLGRLRDHDGCRRRTSRSPGELTFCHAERSEGGRTGQKTGPPSTAARNENSPRATSASRHDRAAGS